MYVNNIQNHKHFSFAGRRSVLLKMQLELRKIMKMEAIIHLKYTKNTTKVAYIIRACSLFGC
jgi:hypothetical protein